MEKRQALSFSILPRWRGGVLLLIILNLVFSSVYCDEYASSSDHGTQYYLADINLTFVDQENGKETYKFYSGTYGIQSLKNFVSGVLVHARTLLNKSGSVVNNCGCTTYSLKKFPTESWVALVARGECDFATKINVATKEHNASAIIIYNNMSERKATVMEHEKAPMSIAVLLQRDEGKEIASYLDRGYTGFITMKAGKKGFINASSSNSISKTSVLFVSISFVVLMIVSLAWLVFYYIQRFRYSHAKEILARRLASAAKKAITKIPQRTLKIGDKELDSDHDQCAVCIEPYKNHEVIRTLPCRHIFHKSCVDPWLLDQRTCPMCKMDILRAFGMQIGGSHESLHLDAESSTHVAAISNNDPEMNPNLEDNEAESVKVTLVSPNCLPFLELSEKSGSNEQAHDEPDGAVGRIVQLSSSTNSLKSVAFSWAGKIDKAEGLNSEMKTLIRKGKDNKQKWKREEKIVCGESVSIVETDIKEINNSVENLKI